jgi:hypothetical protein
MFHLKKTDGHLNPVLAAIPTNILPQYNHNQFLVLIFIGLNT